MSLVEPTKIDHILAVDDTPDNLILVKAILEDEGYEISLASDGLTALKQVQQSPPDLILLDVMMPEMDGYEVARRIRNNPDLPYIPILLITAHERSSVVEGLDAGADDFVRKPFDPNELLARLRSLLRLKHSIDELEEMARQRQDFVSRLTHDLRTPLVAADRMLSLFQQEAFGEISNDMKEAITTMIRSNQNLLQMVNTLLEVQRYEAGQKTLIFSVCNLVEIVEEVIQELKPLVNEKDLLLKIDIDFSKRSDKSFAVVEGDRMELRRVVTNLVGNAIKFTDAGDISIRIEEVANPLSDGADDSSSDWVLVAVQDTGPGISLEDQQQLFERFRQGNHRRAGSGLGLHLSRRIIEEHKGTINVNSDLGKGSTFTVCLPKKQK
jgi:signal transduction histidine kinase